MSNGPLSAPSAGGADGYNQDAYIAGVGSLTYPTTDYESGNYWVDVEVSTVPSSGLLMIGII